MENKHLYLSWTYHNKRKKLRFHSDDIKGTAISKEVIKLFMWQGIYGFHRDIHLDMMLFDLDLVREVAIGFDEFVEYIKRIRNIDEKENQ